MSDKTAINLLRIRACDAEFNEADHPRADNGQFTSGGGGGGAAPAESTPAVKPKKARKPKVEKDWEPNEVEKASWRVMYNSFLNKKFNPKKATPKQMENREKMAEHAIKLIDEEHRMYYSNQWEKHRYLFDLAEGVRWKLRQEKQMYEDAHKGEQ